MLIVGNVNFMDSFFIYYIFICVKLYLFINVFAISIIVGKSNSRLKRINKVLNQISAGDAKSLKVQVILFANFGIL